MGEKDGENNLFVYLLVTALASRYHFGDVGAVCCDDTRWGSEAGGDRLPKDDGESGNNFLGVFDGYMYRSYGFGSIFGPEIHLPVSPPPSDRDSCSLRRAGFPIYYNSKWYKALKNLSRKPT